MHVGLGIVKFSFLVIMLWSSHEFTTVTFICTIYPWTQCFRFNLQNNMHHDPKSANCTNIRVATDIICSSFFSGDGYPFCRESRYISDCQLSTIGLVQVILSGVNWAVIQISWFGINARNIQYYNWIDKMSCKFHLLRAGAFLSARNRSHPPTIPWRMYKYMCHIVGHLHLCTACFTTLCIHKNSVREPELKLAATQRTIHT